MDEEDQLRDAFLRDLVKVCREHNVKIGGCGCCGSPFVTGPDGTEIAVNISADDKSASYGGYVGDTYSTIEVKLEEEAG